MNKSKRASEPLPTDQEYTDLVLDAGKTALKQVSDQDAARIQRARALLQETLPMFGEKSSLELITALGIYLAQRKPAQGQAGRA